ncbi:MAG: D-serine ammonia-lyase, partial [Nesterenkonia sp.]|nr:D-serine ammonia-lyase [Nesterenkonia sp.]
MVDAMGEAMSPESSEITMARLRAAEPTVWLPEPGRPADLRRSLIDEAEERLRRFAPLLERLFPESERTGGALESPLEKFSALHRDLLDGASVEDPPTPPNLWAKRDDLLPISGSVKSRGGIYEVLAAAERIVTEAGLMGDDVVETFRSEPVQERLEAHRVVVGSTGNLGLSIGLTGRALGLAVTVHMSTDAKAWKKRMLREVGADVVEHEGDFTAAATEGRRQAEEDPHSHFVDDERSLDLFAGYAVAGRRLAGQLRSLSVRVDDDHPLFVYLPCGVGGAPGGVTFGLKDEFGDAVRCFFVEPTHVPSVLLGRLTGRDEGIAVDEVGLDGLTVADGLAVPRPSELVGRHMGGLIDGFVTVSDDVMLATVAQAHRTEGARLEPSACAGLVAAGMVGRALDEGGSSRPGLTRGAYDRATHIAWLTGGSMMPEDE